VPVVGIIPVELQGFLVESSEKERPEDDRPHAIFNLLEADILLGQDVAEVDPTAVPADPAIAADEPALEVGRVHKLWDSLGIGSEGRPIERGRGLLAEGLVRAVLVEFLDEGVEPALLGP
jgi:hypothetical protein